MAKSSKKISRDKYDALKELIIECDASSDERFNCNEKDLNDKIASAARELVYSGMSGKERKIMKTVCATSGHKEPPKHNKVRNITQANCG